MLNHVKRLWTRLGLSDSIQQEENMPNEERPKRAWISGSKVAYATSSGRTSVDIERLLSMESVKREIKTIEQHNIKTRPTQDQDK